MPSTESRIPVSTILLTKNSAKSLPRYFEAMRNVDDIILLDGNSTDETVAIAKQHDNCRVFPQDPKFLDKDGYITDFSGMRNYGYSLARHPWILCIDADEYFTDEFLDSVKETVMHGKHGVYFAKRTFTLDGKPVVTLKRSVTDHLRLFHRSAVRGCVRPVHERLDVIPGSYHGKLEGEIMVPLAPVSAIRKRYDRYLALEVQSRKDVAWGTWLRWIFLRNIFSIIRRIGVIIVLRLLPRRGPRFPLDHDYELMRYLVLLTVRTCPLFH